MLDSEVLYLQHEP